MFCNAENPVREPAGNAEAAAPGGPDREGMLLGLSPAGFHEIAFTDWGPIEDKRPIICVHGLTRQGRDFDYLARSLVGKGRRVICPDLPGRGRAGRGDSSACSVTGSRRRSEQARSSRGPPPRWARVPGEPPSWRSG